MIIFCPRINILFNFRLKLSSMAAAYWDVECWWVYEAVKSSVWFGCRLKEPRTVLLLLLHTSLSPFLFSNVNNDEMPDAIKCCMLRGSALQLSNKYLRHKYCTSWPVLLATATSATASQRGQRKREQDCGFRIEKGGCCLIRIKNFFDASVLFKKKWLHVK